MTFQGASTGGAREPDKVLSHRPGLGVACACVYMYVCVCPCVCIHAYGSVRVGVAGSL